MGRKAGGSQKSDSLGDSGIQTSFSVYFSRGFWPTPFQSPGPYRLLVQVPCSLRLLLLYWPLGLDFHEWICIAETELKN